MPRHRKKTEPDRVLLAIKTATFLAAAGLVTGIVLLVNAGAEPPAAANSGPAVPRISPSPPADDAPPSQSGVPTAIAAPTLNTETANIVASPPPAPPAPPASSAASRPSQPRFDFAEIGDRCDDPGAFSVTRDYEPVVCARQQRGSPRWRAI
ncbi:MAG TPA: hypothetical protein VFV67_09440 [Actinophytocola sp.]|uniref:hypothetical protein n=1 Tax=Actinophytocola sp. TaxID=1872138 RepID=UPI002DBC21E3|nr:hypothetical protein [Actinophytocola sp.]HEU5470863.1 hypothetical protein [Actinophytocola sp.]